MGKRKVELVDLTGDDDNDVPRAKAARARQSSHTSPPSSGVQYSCSQSRSHGEKERDTWLSSTQGAEEDMRTVINLSQDDDDSYEDFQLYGTIAARIVGVQYYDGRASPQEYVVLRREPGNPYDRNAIRVDNVMHRQIGHIPRNLAAKLASFMDSGELKVEGVLTGEKGSFDCPIMLKLFGTSNAELAQLLKQKMMVLKLPVNELQRSEREMQKRAKELEKQQKSREKAAAAMRKKGGKVIDMENSGKWSNLGALKMPSEDSEQDLANLLSDAATYNPRELQSVVNKLGAGEDVLSKLKMAEQPERMSTILLPYQRQGLQWMLEHETPRFPTKGSGEIVQLWKCSSSMYSNIATGFFVSKRPDLASGGILADDMGLGKTIQILSLITSDLDQSRKGTLIISPLSVMSNWKEQALRHIKKKYSPKILVYHGQENRGLSPQQLLEYDLVITTYQTMTQELFVGRDAQPASVPTKAGLFSIEWGRIVLDEGHTIRNPKTKMARAAFSLMAKSRWVLTGTPIVNSLKDLHCYVKFLRMGGGLGEFEIFNGTLIRPLKSGDPNAKVLLKALMSTMCLRRMKDMKFVDLKLPGITYHKYTVKFLKHEQKRYDAFKSEALGLVEAAKAKKGDTNITHLLEVLLRLRQTCNHWKLCGEDRIKRLLALVDGGEAVDVLKPENQRALKDLLQLRIDSQEECPVCMDTMTNPRITACAHTFCRDCIEKVIETQHKCPMCRHELFDTGELIESTHQFGESEKLEIEDMIEDESSSSKLEALVKILTANAKESDTKTVIFSQWTSFLDLIERQLLRHDFKFVRLDGKMPVTQRDAAIEALNTQPETTILLASLNVCSVGLNLAAANTVVLTDTWWAPAVEDQAVDRVYRLGQTRACKVIRLVMEGTIEDEVLEIQARKRALVADAFGEEGRQRRDERARTLGDIERLLH